MTGMETSFIQWLVGQTGLVGVAALALWLYSKLAKDALSRETDWRAELAGIRREQAAERLSILESLRGNTLALGEIAEIMRRVEPKLNSSNK